MGLEGSDLILAGSGTAGGDNSRFGMPPAGPGTPEGEIGPAGTHQ